MGSSGAANLWVLLGLGIAGLFIMTKKIKKTIKADFGAFVERFQLLPPPQPAPPKAPHPLTGFSFAVSDMYVYDFMCVSVLFIFIVFSNIWFGCSRFCCVIG